MTDQTLDQDPNTKVECFYRTIDSGDHAGLAAMFTADAAYHRPGCEVLRGRAAIEEFYRGRRAIRSGKHTVTTVVADGRNLAVSGEFRGVMRSGRAAAHRFAEFFEMADDGSFIRRESFLFVPFAEAE